MAEYVWCHDLKGEAERLRLMSDLLDPTSRFHLSQTGVGMGWHCLEIGAGNGSLSVARAARRTDGARYRQRHSNRSDARDCGQQSGSPHV
jgi:hypothetical protein